MTYDVIIAGAGPAGSTCAYECAKRGLRALLLDRDRFPRKKPCGGAVAGQALAHLDFPLPEELIEQECFGAIVRIGGHRIAVRSDTRIAVLVSRDRFDSFLAEKAVQAGAVFHQEEKVIEIVPLGDFVEVMTDRAAYRASYLVGADGVHSVVARSVRPPQTLFFIDLIICLLDYWIIGLFLMTISLVIPAYNEEKYLPAILASIAKLKRQPDELIVVNASSTDKTAEIAKSFGARVITAEKKTIGYSRQLGLRAAKGDIVAFTDADALLPPDWLTRM